MAKHRSSKSKKNKTLSLTDLTLGLSIPWILSDTLF